MEKREEKHPQFADLCHSGVIEQDTDVVSFMYREDYSLSHEEPRQKGEEGNAGFMGRHASWEGRLREVANMTEVIIAKQRTGPIGVEQLSFKLELAWFRDL